MEIFFVTTELAPIAKVGGLADVSAALPKNLKMLGHKVTIVMPRFAAFEDAGLMLARRLTPLALDLGGSKRDVVVYDGRLASQVDLILLDSPGLFDRAGIYGERGEDYPDNALRFGVFARAVAELLAQRAENGSPVDVVHLNDWPSALVATHVARAGIRTRSVLTIHNLAHQGVFPKDALATLDLTEKDFDVAGAEFYGNVNALKQGIVSANVVTTVSSTYAREIQTEEGGCRLDGVIRSKGTIVGVVNGVDYGVWNPATDSSLAARFDAEDASNKSRCRGTLQKKLGLALEPNVPIIASVGRIVQQKGSDVLAETIPRILRGSDAQIVVAGDGDEGLIAKLEAAVAKGPGRASFTRAAPENLVHAIFAAADIVVMPSRFEPCGLVQLIAQRYGALPVVHGVGGLIDTVVDCDAKLETGTGFVFDQVSPDALFAAVQRAVAAHESPRWPALRRRVMRLDRGWERSARLYEQVYRTAVSSA